MLKPIAVKKREIIDVLYFATSGMGRSADELGMELGYISHRPIRAALIELLSSGVLEVQHKTYDDGLQFVYYSLSFPARNSIDQNMEVHPCDWSSDINWHNPYASYLGSDDNER